MDEEHARLIEIFFSYAHADEKLVDGLIKHLRKEYTLWHDGEIMAGMEWKPEINEHLNSADIILLLISPDFKDSDYCNEVEMKRALERQADGETEVIPIFLRTVHWINPPFGHLQRLPGKGEPGTSEPGTSEPVTSWLDQDKAFKNIANGIYKIAESMLKNAGFYIKKGEGLFKNGSYQEALKMYEKALEIKPDNALIYEKKGIKLYSLGRYTEAVEAFEQAIEHDGRNAQLWRHKARTLRQSRRLHEAYEAYIEAIQLNSENPYLYKDLGDVLLELEEVPQAIAAYTRAIQYKENFVPAYSARIKACEKLVQNDREKVRQPGLLEKDE